MMINYTLSDKSIKLVEFSKVRNWHDRMMKFNRGRGFDMIATPFPDEPANCYRINYVDGKAITHGDEVLPEGAAETFENITGTVEGIRFYIEGTFLALTYYGLDGRTPEASYMDALNRLDKAGFSTIPMFDVKGSGWNGLVSFNNDVCNDAKGALQQQTASWQVFPAQPRLAENALLEGLAPAALFNVNVNTDSVVTPEEETSTPSLGGDEAVHKTAISKDITFLVSGRFDRPKEDIVEIIEKEGYKVTTSYDDSVDVVVIPTRKNRSAIANKARKDDSVDLIALDQLGGYLVQHKENNA